MNTENGALTMFVAVMSMLALGYANLYDFKNHEKKQATFYSLLVMVAIMIIFFLVGSFPVH